MFLGTLFAGKGHKGSYDSLKFQIDLGMELIENFYEPKKKLVL